MCFTKDSGQISTNPFLNRYVPHGCMFRKWNSIDFPRIIPSPSRPCLADRRKRKLFCILCAYHYSSSITSKSAWAWSWTFLLSSTKHFKGFMSHTVKLSETLQVVDSELPTKSKIQNKESRGSRNQYSHHVITYGTHSRKQGKRNKTSWIRRITSRALGTT